MKIDGMLGGSFDSIGPRAAALEELGYDGAYVAETSHDGFLPIIPAAQSTERLELGTSIAIAWLAFVTVASNSTTAPCGTRRVVPSALMTIGCRLPCFQSVV